MKLEKVALDEPDSPVLYIEGADLMNGTPIFDIKPYIPYADCHPEATGSFTEYSKDHHLNVEFPQELLEKIPGEFRIRLIGRHGGRVPRVGKRQPYSSVLAGAA